MGAAYLSSGDTEQIEVFASDGASKLTAVSWTLKITRLDNGQYWNGSAWQAGVTTVAMTEPSAANRPGEYLYAFTPPDSGYICSLLAETSDARVAQKLWHGTLSVGYGLALDGRTTRKYIANKTEADSGIGTYTVYEDDQTTPFETGTITATIRTPA